VTAQDADARAAERSRQMIERYLAHLANERRLSRLSTVAYRRDLGALAECTQGTPFEELTLAHIRRTVATLHARGLSGRTLARMLSAWRGFFNYLARDHRFSHNPCLGLRCLRDFDLRGKVRGADAVDLRFCGQQAGGQQYREAGFHSVRA